MGEQAGQGVDDRGRDPRHGQGDRGVGAGRGPKGKGKGATGPQGQAGRGMGARGGGRVEGRGAGGGAPSQPDVQPVRCIPPGIQQMPAHQPTTTTTTTTTFTTSTPTPQSSFPPNPHDPSTSQPPPHRERSRRRWPQRGGGGEAAPAPQAQGPQGEPAQMAGGARPWDRDWGTVPDPLGDEVLPLVGEVYGWLSPANQGTTRGMTNRPFDAVLLPRVGENQEVPPGGSAAPEDHERVLRSVIQAAWPHRGPNRPAFLEGGAVLCFTEADANNWLPQALRSALAHLR